MKLFIRNISFLFAITFFASCSENSPTIPCLSCEDNGGGGSTETVVKKVLIEEFTGVRCVNCPQGSAEIENLLDVHGDNLVAISIHAGFFSRPYDESLFDFQNADGDNLEAFLGPVTLFPAAVVDRTLFDGETRMVVGQATWSAYIAQQLAEAPSISVEVLPTFNEATRELSIDVSGTAQTDLQHDIYLTVLLTETNVVDYQLEPSPVGKNPDYVHKHILRDILTTATGNNISSTLNLGDTYSESFNYSLPSEWEFSNCSVIALIHRNDSEKKVLQVEEIHLSE